MIRALVLVLLLARGAAAATPVVFCETRSGPCASMTKVLGTTAQGSWGQASFPGSATAPPPILYFSRAGYDAAIAGLSRKQRDEAILRRLQLTRDRPVALAIAQVRDDLLAATGGVPLEATAAAAVALDGADRLVGTPPEQLVFKAVEGVARLLVEQPPAAAAERYGQEAEVQRALLAHLGAQARSAVLPHAERQPVAHVAPLSSAVITRLRHMGKPLFPWRAGVVAPFTTAELTALRARAGRPLYAGPEPFLRDLHERTPAQMNVELRRRQRQSPAADRQSLVAQLAFDQAVRCRQIGEALSGTPLAERWTAALNLDTQAARATLTAPPGPAARETLRDSVALATAVARQARDARAVAKLERAAALLAPGTHR